MSVCVRLGQLRIAYISERILIHFMDETSARAVSCTKTLVYDMRIVAEKSFSSIPVAVPILSSIFFIVTSSYLTMQCYVD